jgi:transketolase
VPCLNYFEKQSNDYKEKILNETKYKVSIEAATTDCWKKFVGNNGLCFGIDNFGKSAPYKDAFKHFGLTSDNIVKKIKEMINN